MSPHSRNPGSCLTAPQSYGSGPSPGSAFTNPLCHQINFYHHPAALCLQRAVARGLPFGKLWRCQLLSAVAPETWSCTDWETQQMSPLGLENPGSLSQVTSQGCRAGPTPLTLRLPLAPPPSRNASWSWTLLVGKLETDENLTWGPLCTPLPEKGSRVTL